MRRLVITVCPREPGRVVLPVERGGRAVRMNAADVAHQLQRVIDNRGLTDRVTLREGCAGGCASDGPNVSVAICAMPGPGERPDNVAIGWRTYVGSIAILPCLATVIEENLDVVRRGRTRPGR